MPGRGRVIVLGVGALVVVGVILGIIFIPRQAGAQVVSFTSIEPTQGVTVKVGETTLGNTPFTSDLPPGQYAYVASMEGRRPVNGEFVVSQGNEPVQVAIPPLELLGGQIQIRCNAAAELFVDDQAVGTCSTSGWATVGRFNAGTHQVRAVAPLGAQQKEAIVYDTADVQVEFTWSARLIVETQPTTVTAAILVNGKPYKGPLDVSAQQIAEQPFVQVDVQALGYLPWADDSFLKPGDTVTVTAQLQADTRGADVLGAYRRYWEVLIAANRDVDDSQLATVATGALLEQQVQFIGQMKEMGVSTVLQPAEYTPTIELPSEVTATVSVDFALTYWTVQPDGSAGDHTTVRWYGIYTLARGTDGAWRVARWEDLTPPPTPVPTSGTGPQPTPGSGPRPTPGGGGGGGSAAYPAADPSVVAQVILGSINCVRAEAGVAPVELDPEVAVVLTPLADEAAQAFQTTHSYPPELVARVEAAVAPYGARLVQWSGELVSYVPGLAQWSVSPFEGDWENYLDHPCDTLWATWKRDLWTQADFSRVAIGIGKPYLNGNHWVATIIIAVR